MSSFRYCVSDVSLQAAAHCRVSSLATASLRMTAHGEDGPIALLAPWLFIGANIVIGLIALGTLRLIVQGRLLAPATAPMSPANESRGPHGHRNLGGAA